MVIVFQKQMFGKFKSYPAKKLDRDIKIDKLRRAGNSRKSIMQEINKEERPGNAIGYEQVTKIRNKLKQRLKKKHPKN